MPALESSVPAVEILAYLQRLQMERFEAKSLGLADRQTYMRELDDEIEHCRSVFVAAGVVEIAVLRGQLSGRQAG